MALYAVPKVAAGKLVVVMDGGGGTTEIVTTAEAVFAVGVVESVAVTVIVEDPKVVGVPEIVPVALNVRPADKVLHDEAHAHVYGAVPPSPAKESVFTCPW